MFFVCSHLTQYGYNVAILERKTKIDANTLRTRRDGTGCRLRMSIVEEILQRSRTSAIDENGERRAHTPQIWQVGSAETLEKISSNFGFDVGALRDFTFAFEPDLPTCQNSEKHFFQTLKVSHVVIHERTGFWI